MFRSTRGEDHPDRLVHIAHRCTLRRHLSGQENPSQDAGLTRVDKVLGRKISVSDLKPGRPLPEHLDKL
jgi:hypothetical protein